MPLIAGVARTYRSSGAVDRNELMQEGVVGLLRALKRYDPRLETPFWAYASWWVRQAMQQLVAEMMRPVVLSDRAQRQLARVREARREHLQANGSEPSTAALATATELPRERVERLEAAERPQRSLEEPLGVDESGGGTLGELVADPVAEDGYQDVVEKLEVEDLHDLSDGLDERERTVLHAHYGFGRPQQTLREIAGGLGLSAERVRQIEERALTKMREAAAWPAT
jgi:RNA polymerase primary sigma factor